MQTHNEAIKHLFESFSNATIITIDKLPQAGSERSYFRIHTADKNYIATYGANIKENESFIYFSAQFKKKDLATPQILCINAEKDIYIQDDFGDVSLLNELEEKGMLYFFPDTKGSFHLNLVFSNGALNGINRVATTIGHAAFDLPLHRGYGLGDSWQGLKNWRLRLHHAWCIRRWRCIRR